MTEFDGVDLEDTFVLGWQHDPEAQSLRFDVEASLRPTHPRYRQPKPGEWTCYRRGALTFTGVTGVKGLRAQEQVRPDRDPDGSTDYGSLDALWQEGPSSFRIAGRFGDVEVSCEQ